MSQTQSKTKKPASEPEKPFTMEDEEIICCDCNQPFIFTKDEQEFFVGKGLTHRRRRCKECSRKHKESKNAKSKSTR